MDDAAQLICQRFGLGAWAPVRLEGGLINDSWQVGDPPTAILQRLHSIFEPSVNDDIEAVTAWLESRGMPTPRPLRTVDGALSTLDAEGACWRTLTWIDGKSFHRVADVRHAAEAGALVARWHRAVDGLDHAFAFTRSGVHDTEAHMARMVAALDRHPDHRLRDEVGPWVDAVRMAWSGWDGTLDSPIRLCHGDLKISNLLFDREGRGLCLVDLDTMGWLSLDVELGDAWRSWCNASGEDGDATRFDLAIFEASARGYLSVCSVAKEVRESLPAGVERICWELAARFLADALDESYFGWDPKVAPSRGEHNLLRARGQFALARSVFEQREKMAAILRAV